MGALSQPNTRSTADVLEQMDADGVLFPDAQDALRQDITSVEPLFECDPVLQEHLTRFISLSGVGSGTYFREALIEHREFFATLERRLVEMLPKGKEIFSDEARIAEISSLLDKLHRTELCLDLGRNGYLSGDLFHKTEAYLKELKQGVHTICNSLIAELFQTSDAATFIEAVIDLRDLPQRMRLSVALRFQCSDLSEIQAGDILSIDRLGRYLLLGEPQSGQVDLFSFDAAADQYRRFCGDLNKVLPPQISVTRGIEALNFGSRRPFSNAQPFREGVHVMRPPSLSGQRSYEIGEIVGCHQRGQHEGPYEVLWRTRDLSATVSREREEDLRVFHRGDRPTISDSLAAQALTDDPRSPLCALVRTPNSHSKDREARELTTLCAAILSAEYPLAVHVVGNPWTRTPVVEQLSSRVVVCSQGGLPSEDASFLRRHGCIPVIVVVDSENNHNLTQEIKALREQGWEVIICSNSPIVCNDKYVEHAIADLPALTGGADVTVVDTSESATEPISAAIETIGSRAKQFLDTPFQQRGSHTGEQEVALHALASALDDPYTFRAVRPDYRLGQ